ncbi:hypothetical protein J4232_02250 [Candidatus Woesearchaeota archaeon]|nr:hypothetical protein [Candidatus Woesearchaeota archaeon]
MGDFKRFNRRDSKRFDKDIERRDSGRFSRRDFDRRDSPRPNFESRSNEKRMFRVTCDKCGIKCEVPFNPTEGKPVYCSNCFRKNDSNNSDRKQPQSSERDYSQQLEEINDKLDRILQALQIDD